MNFFKSISVLCLLLSLLTHAQPADQQAENKNTSADIQLQQLKHQLQSQTINSIQDKIDDALKHLELRQDVLDDRSSSIDWWLAAVGIFLAVFGVVGIIVAREKLKEFDGLNQKATTALEAIKTHEKEAKESEGRTKTHEENAELSAKTAEALTTSEKEMTEEEEEEVKASGTKLQKLFLAARQQTDHKQAIGLWKEIITIADYEEDEESLSSGHFNLAYAYSQLEEYKKAIAAWQKAIEIKPDYHEAYYNMGLAYVKSGDYPKVINAYQKAIEIKPDFHEAYYNMGNAYGELKDYQKAIAAYQKAIEIKPDKHEAYNNMGNAYVKSEDYQKAIAAYQKAIEIKPDKHEAYNNMGTAHDELEEYQSAIKAYKQAIAIKPDYHNPYVSLFGLQLLQGQDFEQDLVQQFKAHSHADKTAEMKFAMLTIFKSIDDGAQAEEWQQVFSRTYQGVSFGWSWKEIEDWINPKSDGAKKQALKSALAFFKTL